VRWRAGGSWVPRGIYLAPRLRRIARVGGEGGRLEEGAGRWLRLPSAFLPLVLLGVAVAGLLYVALFPLYGLFLVVKLLVLETVDALRALGHHQRPGSSAPRAGR
jgi:hypothetical protein